MLVAPDGRLRHQEDVSHNGFNESSGVALAAPEGSFSLQLAFFVLGCVLCVALSEGIFPGEFEQP